jgi:hypothetical protein
MLAQWEKSRSGATAYFTLPFHHATKFPLLFDLGVAGQRAQGGTPDGNAFVSKQRSSGR